jgi:hypothetical protein
MTQLEDGYLTGTMIAMSCLDGSHSSFEFRVSSRRATGNAATAFSVLDRPGRFARDFKDMRKVCRETILNERQKQ